jgi:hypothetical protein
VEEEEGGDEDEDDEEEEEEEEDDEEEEEEEEEEGNGEDADADKENGQYLGVNPVRQGRKPKPVGGRARKHISRLPQATINEGPWERPPLAPMQHLNPLTEILNPRKNPNRVEKPHLRRDRPRKRNSTTREDRLEALQMLDSGQEWGIQYNEQGEKEMILKGAGKMSRRRVGQILGFDESQIRRWDKARKKIIDAPRGKRRIGGGRRAQWPELEERLALLWKARVGDGLEVSRRWFERHALEIFDEEYPNEVTMVDGDSVRNFA